MEHSHQSHNTNNHSAIVHFVFLLVGILAILGLYLYFQSTESVVLGMIALVSAHLIAVGILYLIGRGLLRRLIQQVHGVPAETHSHGHDNLETEGNTINWPSLYDILVKVIFLGKEQQFREGVVDMAKIQPQEKVLEVGCGTGTFAIIAKQRTDASVEIHATDAAPEMIQKAVQEAAKAKVNVNFQTGLAERIDFPDNSFDVVMNSFMVHHLPGDLKGKAFAEMYRVLKPNGRIQIVDFEPPQKGLSKMILRLLLGQGMMQINNKTVPPLLEKAGFQSVKMGNTGHPLATYVSGRKAE